MWTFPHEGRLLYEWINGGKKSVVNTQASVEDPSGPSAATWSQLAAKAIIARDKSCVVTEERAEKCERAHLIPPVHWT